MGTLADSLIICRICGQNGGPTVKIFDDDDFCVDLNFFLPIEVRCQFLTRVVPNLTLRLISQVKQESPLPKVICQGCCKEFAAFKAFIVKLNEGQAILAEQLAHSDNIVLKVPNFLSERKCLFKDKFPCTPKVTSAPKPKGDKYGKLTIDEPLERPSRRTRKLPSRFG